MTMFTTLSPRHCPAASEDKNEVEQKVAFFRKRATNYINTEKIMHAQNFNFVPKCFNNEDFSGPNYAFLDKKLPDLENVSR